MQTQTTVPATTATRVGRFVSDGTLLLFGVLLPLAVIVLEGTTGFCAGVFFDPIPTVWHVLLAATVPAANLLVWLALRRDGLYQHRAALGAFNAFAMVVGLYFAWVFLTITPLALFAILFMGMGLLPLSPGLSLLCSAALRWKMRGWSVKGQPEPVPGLLLGVCLALVCVVALYAPPTITRVAAYSLLRGEGGEKTLALLRRFGDARVLENASVRGMDGSGDPLEFAMWWWRPMDREEAQTLYYRMTGRAPAPMLRQSGPFPGNNWIWDTNLGSDQVGPRLAKVALKESRLDGIVDAEAATAYYQWTMLFRNEDFQEREARLRVALPEGAVVSRATLWVNGEEREAAFGRRDQVREAYQAVAVRQRRDPLLVTTSGAGQVLVQCFPIPRDGGEMKIRIGITAPLQVTGPDSAAVALPVIVERNYHEQASHALWITSGQALWSDLPALTAEPDPSGYAVRGAVDDSAMALPRVVSVGRDAAASVTWTDATAGAETRRVVQTIEPREQAYPKALVLAVDLSSGMQMRLGQVREWVKGLPDGMEIAAYGAGDVLVPLMVPARKMDESARTALVAAIAANVIKGGADNVPALENAWDVASRMGADVLWLHEAQPFRMKSVDGLSQRLERRPGTLILSAGFTTAKDAVVERLDGQVRAVRVLSAADVAELVRGPAWAVQRRELAEDEAPPAGARKTDAHLTRLWVADEVARLIQSGTTEARNRAVALASRAQLVTPVTGAVVLETAQQFAQHNLQPVDSDTVPGIPEPTMLGVLGLGAYLLGRRPRRGTR